MKKQLLTKMLLAVALLGMGSSAWAVDAGTETTVANIDFSSGITLPANPTNNTLAGTVTGTVGSMSVVYRTDYTTFVSNAETTLENSYKPGAGALVLSCGVWNVSLGYNIVGSVDIAEADRAGYAHIAEEKNNDKVTITFKLSFGSLSGKYTGFALYDGTGTKIAALQYCRYGNYSYNGSSVTFGDNTFGIESSDITNNSQNNASTGSYNVFTITLDYKNATMSCKTNTMATAKTVAMTNTNPLAKFCLISNYSQSKSGDNFVYTRSCLFDDLTITNTEGDYTTPTANYTVKYKCNGEEVKEEETRTGDVGSAVSLLPGDTQNFFNNDESKRYIYVSDDSEGKTVAEGGTTVVTVTVREAEKWDYTVTSSYTVEETKNTLDWSTSGWVWEDLNSVTISYPRYQAFGTTLVGRAPVSNDLRKSITVANDDYTEDFAYTSEGITNLYLLREAETLGVGTEATTSFSTRVSGGKMIYGSSGTLITLPSGKYIFTLGAIGGENNDAKRASYVVKAGETIVASGDCIGNSLALITGSEFTLTGTTPITFTATNTSADRGIDLIYVQKTGDADLPATTPVTLGKNGYATFASVYDLDLSNLSSFKAYTATLTSNELSFTQCTAKVVAGTGLLLKGDGDANVTIPVVATGATAVDGNALTGVTANTDLQSDAESNYIFVLKKASAVSDALTFLPLSTTSAVTVPAGKAYVSVHATAFTGGARSLNVSFGDNTTSITSIDATTLQENIYNLSGQRIMKPAKGLYIVNGKKVIINK